MITSRGRKWHADARVPGPDGKSVRIRRVFSKSTHPTKADVARALDGLRRAPLNDPAAPGPEVPDPDRSESSPRAVAVPPATAKRNRSVPREPSATVRPAPTRPMELPAMHGPTLGHVFERYRVDGMLHLSPKERSNRPNMLRRFLIAQHGDVSVTAVDRRWVERWLSELSRTPGRSGSPIAEATVRQMRCLLSRMMAWAKEEDLVASNPVTGTRMPRPVSVDSRAPDVLSPEEEQAFVEAARTADGPWGEIGFVLLKTGMRLGEALALRAEDLDLANERAYVTGTRGPAGRDIPKGRRSRQIGLCGATVELLAHRCEAVGGTGPLWPSGRGAHGLYDVSAAGKAIGRETFDRIDATPRRRKELGCHLLRHTFACRMRQTGASIDQIGAQLGHRTPSTTLIYLRENLLDTRQAVAAASRYAGSVVSEPASAAPTGPARVEPIAALHESLLAGPDVPDPLRDGGGRPYFGPEPGDPIAELHRLLSEPPALIPAEPVVSAPPKGNGVPPSGRNPPTRQSVHRPPADRPAARSLDTFGSRPY